MQRISMCILVSALFLLGACGQKGPLYLPGDPSQVQTDLPSQINEAAEEAAADDDDTEDDQ